MTELKITAHCWRHKRTKIVTEINIAKVGLTLTFDCGFKTTFYFEG